MEHEVEKLRRAHSVRNNRSSRSKEETEILIEQGMRVPISVLNSCNETFTAADEKHQKISLKVVCQIYLISVYLGKHTIILRHWSHGTFVSS